MDTTWPVLTPLTPEMRWFQRGVALLAAGAVTLTALLAVDGLAV